MRGQNRSDSPVRNIPAGHDFLQVLARGTLELTQVRGLSLSEATILLPNRRSVREFSIKLAEVTGAPSLLLPQIRAIGDLEPDEEPFSPGDLVSDIPESIGKLDRLYRLAQLIRAMAESEGREVSLSVPASIQLARMLADLIDEAASHEGINTSVLEALYDVLPEHLQRAGLLLDVLATHWPAILAERGVIDPGERKARLLRLLAQHWIAAPPQGLVMIAGSTGSLPATADLIASIIGAPHGVCVLPGFDDQMEELVWDGLDEGHPQRGMKRLLDRLGIVRSDVMPLIASDPGGTQAGRVRFLNDALRPADLTADWVERAEPWLQEDRGQRALLGLEVIEAEDASQEARIVAATVAAGLAGSEGDVMIVCPDLGLLRRIEAQLDCLGIPVNSSAGRALFQTSAGQFLRGVLSWLGDPAEPLQLMSLMQHPLFGGGVSAQEKIEARNWLDRHVLRGLRGASLAQIGARIHAAEREPPGAVHRIMDRLHSMAGEGGLERLPIAQWTQRLVRAAEGLAERPDEAGSSRLWKDEDGEAAGVLMREFVSAPEIAGPVSIQAYGQILLDEMGVRQVRYRRSISSRVRALSPIEARLQTADHVILSGLNEGSWPSLSILDPFTSNAMRNKLKLPLPEQRLGQSAHDFVQLAAAPRVTITRALRDAESPLIASRWIWRLRMFAKATRLEAVLFQDASQRDLLMQRDRLASSSRPIGQPLVVSALPRPAQLSVTTLEKLLPQTRSHTQPRDAFAVWAAQILNLRKLDAKNEANLNREIGVAIHSIVEACQARIDHLKDEKAVGKAVFEAACDWMETLGLGPAEQLTTRRRLLQISERFAAFQLSRLDHLIAVDPEVEAREDRLIHGQTLKITGKIDRVETLRQGIAIFDLKSGGTQWSSKHLKEMRDPQVLIYSWLMARGAVTGFAARMPVIAGIVALKSNDPFEKSQLGGDVIDDAVRDLEVELEALLKDFFSDDFDFSPMPKADYSDFDVLARRCEWAALDAISSDEVDNHGQGDA